MSCACQHTAHNNVGILAHNASVNYDPTRTIALRRRFSQAMAARFIEVRRAVREAIVDYDVLGLTDRRFPITHAGPAQYVIPVPGFKAYDFPRSERKVDEFMAWLNEWSKREVLGDQAWEVFRRTGRYGGATDRWTDYYVRTAYQRGIARGRNELKKTGLEVSGTVDQAFNQAFHVDRVGLLYTRTFTDLAGVTDVMAQQMSRVLAQGIAEGRNPRQMARHLTDRVNKIGITRARTIARTEVIRAHAEAALTEYEYAGVEQVALRVEWTTAGFNVCPVCSDMARRGPYEIREIRGMIPAHPNCRCAPIPYTRDLTRPRVGQTGPQAGGAAPPKPKPKPKPKKLTKRQRRQADLRGLTTQAEIQDYVNHEIPAASGDTPIFRGFENVAALSRAREIADNIFELDALYPAYMRSLREFNVAATTSEFTAGVKVGNSAMAYYAPYQRAIRCRAKYANATGKKNTALFKALHKEPVALKFKDGKHYDYRPDYHTPIKEKDVFKNTMFHEFGHHVDSMYSEQLAKFNAAGKNAFSNDPGKKISGYATKNARESFAEAFCSYFVTPKGKQSGVVKAFGKWLIEAEKIVAQLRAGRPLSAVDMTRLERLAEKIRTAKGYYE